MADSWLPKKSESDVGKISLLGEVSKQKLKDKTKVDAREET